MEAKVGQTENATYDDLEELVQMSMDNYVEEYSGQGQRTIDDKRNETLSGINSSTLYLQRAQDSEICSIVQIINGTSEDPMIGNLFTKVHFRSKGYAFSLLHTVTDGLLKNGCNRCGLLSDKSNPASNKIFEKSGYKPIYEWINLFKERHENTV